MLAMISKCRSGFAVYPPANEAIKYVQISYAITAKASKVGCASLFVASVILLITSLNPHSLLTENMCSGRGNMMPDPRLTS